MTTGIAFFDYTTWVLRYPEFSSVGQPLAQMYWNEATLYCDNTPCSIVRDVVQRTMLTAHICALNAALNNTPSSPLVGRINNATEGSVSVAMQLDVPQGTAQWFAQTKYGIAYWAATAQFRSMRYVPGPTLQFTNIYGPATIVRR